MNEQLQQQIRQLVELALQGNQEANLQILKIAEAALQGDQEAALLMQIMQQMVLQIQQEQTRIAKFGAKLNYIKQLRGMCPDGYETQYFKSGGQMCKKCVPKTKMKDGGAAPKNPVDAFKCGRKMKKKVKKAEEGSQILNREYNPMKWQADTIQAWNGEFEVTQSGDVRKQTDEGGTIYTDTKTNKTAGIDAANRIIGDPDLLNKLRLRYNRNLKSE